MSWLGNEGFDEAKYYKDEKYEIGLHHSDEKIKKTILEAFKRHYSLAVADIEVKVDDGIVTLSGKVQGYQERKEAGDLVCHFSGVRGVRNDLVF